MHLSTNNETSSLKAWTIRLLQWIVIISCLLYAFWDLDLELFISVVTEYNIFAVLVALSFTFLGYVILACRFKSISEGQINFTESLKGTMIGQGANNIMPAKLGEAVKAFYLARESGKSSAWLIGLVFWERFFDLNTLFVLGVLIMDLMTTPLSMGAFFMLVCAIWILLAATKKYPNAAKFIVHKIPVTTVREFAFEFIEHLIQGLRIMTVIKISGWTALIWLLYIGQVAIILMWAAQLDLSLAAILVIFVVSGVGLNLAASPGGLGVYEAFIVISASWFGVLREEALASAIVLHVIQYVPSTVLGLLLMSQVNISYKQVKNQSKSI